MPWELLARYFADELEVKKKRELESYINESPKRKKRIEELRRIWSQSSNPEYELDTEQAWKRLASDIDELEKNSKELDQVVSDRKVYINKRTRDFHYKIATTTAAAVTIIFALFFAYKNYSTTTSKPNQELAKQEIKIGTGERAIYTLRDGSKVILHAGSRLEIPLKFNKNKRELYLEGEAYFEVSHDKNKPFIVNVENAYTRVLGTKFLVRAWPDKKNEIDVIVTEGSVALGAKSQKYFNHSNEAVIIKNQKGHIGKTGIPEVATNIDVNWHLGWVKGKLTFENRPLNEIIPKLEAWYAIDIKTANEQIREKKLTAEIDYTQPMDEVLRGIALSLDLKFEKNNRTVTFH